MTCPRCHGKGCWACFVHPHTTPVADAPDPDTRLALLEGQARDQSAQLKRLPELAAEVDRLHSQLVDCQRRLQALESVEAMIQRGVEAFCSTLEAK